MNRYLIAFLLVCLHYSCVRENNLSDGTKQIHFSLNKKDRIDADYFIDSIEYVKLETDSNYLVDHIRKIIFYNRSYYLLNGRSDAIYVFDRAGKFVSKLFRPGEGPDEYGMINDFTIDRQDSSIVVLDVAHKKFLTYNMNWELIGKKETPCFIRSFIHTASTGILTYQEAEGFTALDFGDGNKYVVLPFPKKYPAMPLNDMGYLYWIDNKNGIFSVADNAVYRWDGNKLEKKYQLTYSKTTPADVYGGKTADFDICIAMHHETSRWILQVAISMKGKDSYYLLYDKKQDKVFTINKIDNLRDAVFPPAAPSLADDRLIYSQFIPATELKKQLAAYPESRVSDGLKAIIRTSTDDDNPVLQIIYLKK